MTTPDLSTPGSEDAGDQSRHEVTRFVGIIGMPRCGSTVLGMTLARSPSTIFVGESRQFSKQWQAGRPCGCGKPLNECEFWGGVIQGAPGDTGAVLDQRDAAKLLRNAGALCGASVIVDSGKAVREVLALADEVGLAGTLIHLVRDPRGHLVSSHQGWRGKSRSDLRPTWKQILRIIASWWRNQVAALVALRDRPHLLIRYEDFVSDPERIVQKIGATPEGLDRTVLRFEHVIAGNPARFSTEPLQLKLDSRWHGMSRTRQLAVYVLGMPFTLRHRYPLWVSPEPKS